MVGRSGPTGSRQELPHQSLDESVPSSEENQVPPVWFRRPCASIRLGFRREARVFEKRRSAALVGPQMHLERYASTPRGGPIGLRKAEGDQAFGQHIPGQNETVGGDHGPT